MNTKNFILMQVFCFICLVMLAMGSVIMNYFLGMLFGGIAMLVFTLMVLNCIGCVYSALKEDSEDCEKIAKKSPKVLVVTK